MPMDVKRRYFELIRTGMRGGRAAAAVGVSLSCGSVWFIDAGSVSFIETPISGRYLSQDDRIEIADGLARGEPVKSIAARIGKTFRSVYRETARHRTPDGSYQPWYAPNQAYLRRRRPHTGAAGEGRTSRAGGGHAAATLVAGADLPLAAAPVVNGGRKLTL